MDVVFKNPKLYFISGKARSGKSTVSQILKEEYEKKGKKAVILSYARYHKDYAISFFGWDGSEETKPRELLQQLGTDIIRQKLNMPLFFINRMIEDIKILSYFFDVIIVSNARFKDEIDIQRDIFKKIITIRVERPNFDNGLTEEQKNHPSEVDLDDYDKFDYYIINDESIKDLRPDVQAIIDKEGKLDEKND